MRLQNWLLEFTSYFFMTLRIKILGTNQYQRCEKIVELNNKVVGTDDQPFEVRFKLLKFLDFYKVFSKCFAG